MHFAKAFLLTCLFQSSDTPPSINPSTTAMQQSLMTQTFVLPTNIRQNWWHYALRATSSQDDCCTWRNVECTDGIVTVVVLAKRNAFSMLFHMLPQTVQNIHITYARMQRFLLRDLPRDLRFVLIMNTVVNEIPTWDKKSFHTADLPYTLEEAKIDIRTPIFNFVVIEWLPPNLRILHLGYSKFIQRVSVDNACLPDGLEKVHVRVDSNSAKAVIASLHGGKVDPRISCKNRKSKDGIRNEDLWGYAKGRAIWEAIITEVH